jgi:hypothetical protein
MGFSYKKPNLVPGKADAAKQRDFLDMLEGLKKNKKPLDKLYTHHTINCGR